MTPTSALVGLFAGRPSPAFSDRLTDWLAEDGPNMFRLLLIFFAGGCGCLLRYGVAGWAQRFTNSSFPTGTLAVNVIGCLALGFLATFFTGPVFLRTDYRLAILVGLLGGFTTFSTFAYETIMLTDDGQFTLAALNLLLSNALGLVAAWLGTRLTLVIYGT